MFNHFLMVYLAICLVRLKLLTKLSINLRMKKRCVLFFVQSLYCKLQAMNSTTEPPLSIVVGYLNRKPRWSSCCLSFQVGRRAIWPVDIFKVLLSNSICFWVLHFRGTFLLSTQLLICLRTFFLMQNLWRCHKEGWFYS